MYEGRQYALVPCVAAALMSAPGAFSPARLHTSIPSSTTRNNVGAKLHPATQPSEEKDKALQAVHWRHEEEKMVASTSNANRFLFTVRVQFAKARCKQLTFIAFKSVRGHDT